MDHKRPGAFNQHLPATGADEACRVSQRYIKALFFITEPVGAQLTKVMNLVKDRNFVPALDSVYPLEKFEEAFRKLESGKAKGKIVLDMGLKPTSL